VHVRQVKQSMKATSMLRFEFIISSVVFPLLNELQIGIMLDKKINRKSLILKIFVFDEGLN